MPEKWELKRKRSMSYQNNEIEKYAQYLGDEGDAIGDVGEYLGDDGDKCVGDAEKKTESVSIDVEQANKLHLLGESGRRNHVSKRTLQYKRNDSHLGEAGLNEGLVGE